MRPAGRGVAERRAGIAWAWALVFLLVAPPASVGLVGLGFAVWSAAAMGLAIATVTAWWAGPRLAGALAAALPTRPLWVAILAALSVLLLVPSARLSVFMADPSRTDFAYFTGSPAWLYHSCFTAYIEADRLAQDRSENIYDATHYENRELDRFKVDTYYYPPPFLVQTRAVAVLGHDFATRRALWYALQSLTFAAVALFMAAWVGGPPGGRALLLLPLLYSAQPVLAGLQYGNVQVTAVTTATLGVLLIASARPVAGGALLALATVSKIFPGLLGLYALTARRWRGVLWTALWAVGLVAYAVLMVGTKPFVDFVVYEVPLIQNMSAFPQAEWPRTAAVNLGVYGLVVKLRHLGLSWLDADAGRRVTDIYGFVLLVVTALLGSRESRHPLDLVTGEGRARAVVVWLALVGLASYRSPFVGFAYGGASTMWLLWLMTASARRTTGVWVGIGAFAFTAFITSLVPPPADRAPIASAIVASLVVQFAMLGINVAALVMAFRWKVQARGDSASQPVEGWRPLAAPGPDGTAS